MGTAAANLDFWKKAYKDEDSTGPVVPVGVGRLGDIPVLVEELLGAPGPLAVGLASLTVQRREETETDTRQVNVHVENRFWWDSLCRNYSYVSGSDTGWSINENRTHTYSVEGGQMGALVLPVVTVGLPIRWYARPPYGRAAPPTPAPRSWRWRT
mgnify:CR=1 FL=1